MYQWSDRLKTLAHDKNLRFQAWDFGHLFNTLEEQETLHFMEMMLDDIGALLRTMYQQREIIVKFGRDGKEFLRRESASHAHSDSTCIQMQGKSVAQEASDLAHKIELQTQDFERLKQAATDTWNKVRSQIQHTNGN